jgi:acetyl-CoA C-acetyltransferase
MTIKRKAFIAGIYEHPRRDIPDRSVNQIHAELAVGAVADAGLSLSDVDGSSPTVPRDSGGCRWPITWV